MIIILIVKRRRLCGVCMHASLFYHHVFCTLAPPKVTWCMVDVVANCD